MIDARRSPPADTSAARSQTSLAYQRLRADIMFGRHAPGARLKINDLAQRMEVSPGAIREGLSRLVAEQLVVSQDQKGFAVAPLSIQDLEDLTDLRCEVEAIALRRALANGDDAWEAAVLAAAHRLSRVPPRVGRDLDATMAWIARHAEFHAALVSACGSRRLRDLHAQLYEQSERYRGLSAHADRDRDVGGEHQAIVDAALARDADRLVDLMVRHIRATTALIIGSARLAAAE
ncbi:GntR family transcriptional regulator [Phenylobacterium sp.]|uniref:GntR family transcriptional regulator n=1 Tax=Phenylobacterium sp. TaxID=1871053 RepID=UPI003BA9B063